MLATSAEIEAIFYEALQKELLSEQAAYLDHACGEDAELRAEVESLLTAHAKAVGVFEWPVVSGALDKEVAKPTEGPGTLIGRYKLLEVIGEGGFGVVYLAEQTEPVQRKVALKIIKPGMDSQQVVARFEAEEQALAMMDYPHIATVHDAGATESGRPYFVMELVDGIPLTEYCDQNDLTAKERLGLFIDVCQAVQHAHQKGIIHRDIKPTNVMVALQDGVPVPKIIDFGIAKATDRHLTERTAFTSFGQMLGTPLYMSPEQAEMGGLDIDTRSDIYSLGVLLYELLTGSTPFDEERIREAGYDEMRRMIREEEPPRPSDRISTLAAEAATTASTHRKTDPAKLSHLLRGELDWIVMKALEKDRARRYDTANAFARDIQRYLNDEAVEACPPSTTYRLRKFAQRHKAKLVAVATIAAVLLFATVVSSSLAAWALHAEGVAGERLAGEQAARRDAQHQAEKAEWARQTAVHERDVARDHLYRADMRLGLVDAEAGTVHRLFRKLERHVAAENGYDRRGWEWYYLLGQCQQAERTLYGHYRHVSDVSWSPDGRHVASVSYDHKAKAWDTESWRPVRTIERGRCIKCCAAWDPHGKRFAWGSAGDDNTVHIWNTDTDEVQTLRGNTFSVWGIAWCPNGKRLASSSTEDTIVWNTDSGEKIRTIEGSFGYLAWHPDGSLLASAGRDGLRVSDPTNGQVALDNKPLNWDDRLESVAWRQDGKQLAIGGYGKSSQLTFVDTDDWQMQSLSTRLPGAISSIAYSPDGRLVATGRSDNLVRVWDVSSRELIRTFCGHRGRVTSVSWSPDGRRLVSGSEDLSVRIWSLDRPQHVRTLRASATGPNHSVSWAADSRAIAATGGGRVWLWDAASGQPRGQAGPDGFWRARFCPAHSLLASAKVFDSYVSVVVREVDSPQTAAGFVTGISGLSSPRSLSWSADGHLLAVGGFSNPKEDLENQSRVEVWNVDSGEQVFTTPQLYDHFDCAAWAPDNERLAFSYHSYSTGACPLAVYSTRTGSLIGKMPHHHERENILALCWTPNGKWLTGGTAAGRIHVWDVDQAVTLQTIQAHSVRVTVLDWSPDGSCLVSGSADGTVRLWDASGEERLTFVGSGDSVADVQWSDDGKQLASIDSSGRVTVWDASAGYEYAASDAYSQERAVILCEDADGLDSGGQWKEVVEIASRAIEMDPRSFLARRRRATAHHRLGNLNEALADWSALLDLESGSRFGWENRGMIYAALGQWEKASTDFREISVVNGDIPRAWYLQALVYLRRGDRSAYQEVCQEVLERFADTLQASTGQDAAWTCAVGPQAVTDFEPVVALARRLPTQYCFVVNILGAVLYRAGRLPQAARTFNDLVSHWDNDIQGCCSEAPGGFFLAMTHHRLGHAAEAKQWMAKASEWTDTELAEKSIAWDRRATLELLRTEAQEVLQTSVPVEPEAIEKAPGQEQRDVETQQPDKPPQDSAVTPHPEPTRETAYADRGDLYAALGRNEEALAEFQKALAVPGANHTEIHRRCSKIYMELGQHDKAIAACKQALRAEPDNAEILYELGNNYLAKCDLPQAVVAGYWEWHANLARRLRDEAAGLLGITETRPEKPDEEEKADQTKSAESGTPGQEASNAGDDVPAPALP